jgi:hypothetical protein
MGADQAGRELGVIDESDDVGARDPEDVGCRLGGQVSVVVSRWTALPAARSARRRRTASLASGGSSASALSVRMATGPPPARLLTNARRRSRWGSGTSKVTFRTRAHVLDYPFVVKRSSPNECPEKL